MTIFVSPMVSSQYYNLLEEKCINDTHIRHYQNVTETVDGVVIESLYESIIECTNNCSNNKCLGTNPYGDMAQTYMVYGVGVVLLIIGTVLGLPLGNTKEDMTKGNLLRSDLAIKYIFFFVGFGFLYLSLAMARGYGITYGGSQNLTSASSTATLVLMITFVLFLFLFILEFVSALLEYLAERNAKTNYGELVDV